MSTTLYISSVKHVLSTMQNFVYRQLFFDLSTGLQTMYTIGLMAAFSPPSFTACLARQAQLTLEFRALPDTAARYEHLIEMGRPLRTSNTSLRHPQNLVSGCQSEVYLVAQLQNGKVYFSVYSEALISAGLAALLLAIYDGETIETILGCSPTCITEMGILASLTPGRSNGLASMHLRMKQEAIRLLKQSMKVE